MDCPLCGLEQPTSEALAEHTDRTHGHDLDSVERMLREGRRDFASDIERHWENHHGTRLRQIGDDPEDRHHAGADIRGGYL